LLHIATAWVCAWYEMIVLDTNEVVIHVMFRIAQMGTLISPGKLGHRVLQLFMQHSTHHPHRVGGLVWNMCLDNRQVGWIWWDG
jgi:hypothetical protein